MRRTGLTLALLVFAVAACTTLRNLNTASECLPTLLQHADSAVLAVDHAVSTTSENVLQLTAAIIDAAKGTTAKLDTLVDTLMALTMETSGAVRTQNANMAEVMNSVRNTALAAGGAMTAITAALIGGSHWLNKRDRRKVHG